jgi:hypothetical protein
MNNSTLEGLLGMIVFGPHTDTPVGVQYTAARLRQAATLLEYRYAIERREDQFVSQQVAMAEADNSQRNQQAPARPKRQRGRPAKTAANGAAHDEPVPPADEPLFQTADSALSP